MSKKTVFHDPLPPLQVLLWQQCWAAAAGAGTGAIVSFHFGRKLPRPKPLDNPAVGADLRTHQGEAILFIECRWSVTSKNGVSFDSDEDRKFNGRVARAIKNVVGSAVLQIRATMPPSEIVVSFDNGSTLELHADPADPDDPHDNFSLSFGDTSYVIGPDLGLRLEPRRGIVPLVGLSARSVRRRRAKV